MYFSDKLIAVQVTWSKEGNNLMESCRKYDVQHYVLRPEAEVQTAWLRYSIASWVSVEDFCKSCWNRFLFLVIHSIVWSIMYAVRLGFFWFKNNLPILGVPLVFAILHITKRFRSKYFQVKARAYNVWYRTPSIQCVNRLYAVSFQHTITFLFSPDVDYSELW